MLTEKAFDSFKTFVETNIAYAKVEFDKSGKPEKVAIHRRERLKDGRIALSLSITPEKTGKTIVTRVQLYDNNNDLWADKTENILLKDVQEGVLYRFSFDFREV